MALSLCLNPCTISVAYVGFLDTTLDFGGCVGKGGGTGAPVPPSSFIVACVLRLLWMDRTGVLGRVSWVVTDVGATSTAVLG